MGKRTLVAVAGPYASGPRPLGHVAGFGVPSDVFPRYQRMQGNDVLMVSGTDEHGTPITVRAEKEGKTPQEVVDFYNTSITDDLAHLGCSYNLFTRTTTANHYAVTQDVFARLRQGGFVTSKTALGSYSETENRFLPDRYVEGQCPHCGYKEARGDQCDNCGRQLDPSELIEPHSRITNSKLTFRESEHFFLDLPAFSERLRVWAQQQVHWRPNVRNFTLGLLDEGLQPRAITRDIEWGVPIPDAPSNMEGKRIYVWFDAVIGYLSAAKEWATIQGKPELWKKWWQDPDVHHYYFMGKDNIIFHSLIWPAMLMGYGGLNLPYDVVASEFLTMEGKRFSTSRGLAIWLPDYFSRYEADPLRYYLMINGPESADTDFSWAEFLRRNNDELVATWGNLAHRVLTFTFKNFGCVPDPGELQEVDRAILAQAEAAFAAVGEQLDACHFRAAISAVMSLAQAGNQYLDQMAPWQTIKTDKADAGRALYVALRVIDSLKTLFCPFLPHSSQKLHEYLGYKGYIAGPLQFENVTEANSKTHRVLTCDTTSWVGTWQPSQLPIGQPLLKPDPLFKKLEPTIVDEELARMTAQ